MQTEIKKCPSKSPGLYMYVRYANIITMVHLTALDSRPGGGGGGGTHIYVQNR